MVGSKDLPPGLVIFLCKRDYYFYKEVREGVKKTKTKSYWPVRKRRGGGQATVRCQNSERRKRCRMFWNGIICKNMLWHFCKGIRFSRYFQNVKDWSPIFFLTPSLMGSAFKINSIFITWCGGGGYYSLRKPYLIEPTKLVHWHTVATLLLLLLLEGVCNGHEFIGISVEQDLPHGLRQEQLSLKHDCWDNVILNKCIFSPGSWTFN